MEINGVVAGWRRPWWFYEEAHEYTVTKTDACHPWKYV